MKELKFGDMVGNSVEFRTNEELKEIVGEFMSYLKLKKASWNVYNMEIHISTAKYWYDITEKRTNKFVIVKEDKKTGNRTFMYAGM